MILLNFMTKRCSLLVVNRDVLSLFAKHKKANNL